MQILVSIFQRKKNEFESTFLNTLTGWIKLNHLLVQCGIDSNWALKYVFKKIECTSFSSLSWLITPLPPGQRLLTPWSGGVGGGGKERSLDLSYGQTLHVTSPSNKEATQLKFRSLMMITNADGDNKC